MIKLISSAVAGFAMACAVTAEGVEVSGKIVNPNTTYPAGTDFKVTGETLFAFWGPGGVGGDIDLNGNIFEIGCGGNKVSFSGAVSGTGTFRATGPANLTLGGDKPNTFAGPFAFACGSLHLAKPAGVDALPGDLVLGTQSAGATLVLENSDQLNDACHLTVEARSKGCGLSMQGHSETIASLTVKTDLEIDMGDAPSSLIVTKMGPDQLAPEKVILVRNFKPGKDTLLLNAEAGGLTARQLANIGFLNPGGKERGTYGALLATDKRLEPGQRVVPKAPPFDLSEPARAERQKRYDIPGLANLTGPATPLKAGMKIVAFGDSITMQGRYTKMMGDALSKGEGTKGLGIQLVRYGLNGGRVPDLLAGKSLKGDFKATMEELLQKEKPDVVSIWIGVNDVWFGEKGTTPETFEAGLRKMVALCHAVNAKVVLAPVAVLKEDAGHWNPKCDQYAEITRKVAKETGSALADLRHAFVAYTRNHGYDILPNGALRYEGTVLAFDGVHINDTGAAIAANLISQAIYDTLKK
jgi:lysophospholipase L1-like esterase